MHTRELNGYTFGIRKVTAMEAFANDIAETNQWVLGEVVNVDRSLAEIKVDYLKSSLAWLRLALVWGKRPGSDVELPIYLPEMDALGVLDGRPIASEAIDIQMELDLDFLPLAQVCRAHSGVSADDNTRVLENFFRLALLPQSLQRQYEKAKREAGEGEEEARPPAGANGRRRGRKPDRKKRRAMAGARAGGEAVRADA